MDQMIFEYLDKLRRQGGQTRKVFENNLDFVNAVNSEVGQVLLKDLITRHEHIFERIASLNATDAEKETYQYLNGMLAAWSARISNFNKRVEEFQESLATKARQKGVTDGQ